MVKQFSDNILNMLKIDFIPKILKHNIISKILINWIDYVGTKMTFQK